MAILSAAIGAYLVLAPPPDLIAPSVMEDGGGGNTHGDVAVEGVYSPAQQFSLRANKKGETDDISVAKTTRPSLEPPASPLDKGKESKSGDVPVPEETTSEEKEPNEIKSSSANKTPEETTSNNATKARSKERASKPVDKIKTKKMTKENVKKTAAIGPLFHMVFTTGSTTLSTLNVRSIESVFHANPNGRLHIHQPKLLFTANNNSTALLDKTHPRLAPLI